MSQPTPPTRPGTAEPRQHDYAEAEPSNSGKRGWRCRVCGRYTNAPVKAKFDPCPGAPTRPGTAPGLPPSEAEAK